MISLHGGVHWFHTVAPRGFGPVRVVWGTDDKLLPWPSSAARYRNEWLAHAGWVELGGIGHCPQLDRSRPRS